MKQIHGQYDLEDYRQAVLLHMRPGRVATWLGYLGFGAAGLMVLGGLLLVVRLGPSAGQSLLPGLLLALLCLIVPILFRFGLLPLQTARVFKQQKDATVPFEMTLSDEEFYVQNEFGSSRLPWQAFTKWKEDNALFLLYRSDVLFNMLPKRLLHSPEEIEYVRARLQANGVPPAGRVKNPLEAAGWLLILVVVAAILVVAFWSRQ